MVSISRLSIRFGYLLNITRSYGVSNLCFCKEKSDRESIESSLENKEPPIKKLLDEAASFDIIKPTTEEDVWSTSPYPEVTNIKRNQGNHSLRPTSDPRETTIIMFPGQGNQFVGMGKDLLRFPIARDIFTLANEVLGYDLLKLCLKGPKSELDKTVHCQPATLVTSLAALECLKEERPNAIENCVATAGYSLGELTALVFANAIPFDKALKLVQIRAEAMQMASDMAAGSMATVLYGPDSDLGKACINAKQWCVEHGVEHAECRIGAYLYPHCKVISGNIEALKYLEANAKQYKLRRVLPLSVSGAFHSELMAPATDPFKRALKKITISEPIISVHSNVDGKRYKNVAEIVNKLPKQIVKPVRWEQTLHILYERSQGQHFPKTFECGPGKSLSTILKQVNAKAWDSCVSIQA